MRITPCSAALSAGWGGGFVALWLVAGPFLASQLLNAQTDRSKTDPLPAEWRYVPHNAALFLHADIASVWTSQLARSLRQAEPKSFAQIENFAQDTLGTKIDDIQTLTLFVPQIAPNADTQELGVIVKFSKPFDAEKITAGFTALMGRNAQPKIHTIAQNTALILVRLDDATYGKPQPAEATGYLTDAIRAAARGKHTLVAAAAPALLPEEFQRDDLPDPLRPFQPLLRAKTLYATLDLQQSLQIQVHVNTKREAQAVDAEKALAALVELLTEMIRRELPDLEKSAEKDANFKGLLKLAQTALQVAKDAKYSVNGSRASLTATFPLEGLPLASAYQAAMQNIERTGDIQLSANKLKQIALAMHNYADDNNTFPPAAVCDKRGKPLLSWRVLILPYLDQEALYREFKLDEPWDSEHNKKLLAKMPAVYRGPGAKPDATTTHYRVFVGNGAGFDWVMGTKFADITDGTSNTLMVVTAAEAVPWTKPDELEYDTDKDVTKWIGMVVRGHAQVAMFDGSVRTLSQLPSKQTLHALITKGGGEVIGNDF